VGGKVYIDKQIFSFADNSDGTCKIEACSESQVSSVYDYSTNYCDIHNLYCSDDVCNPIASFETTETDVTPNLGSGGKDPSKCGPSKTTLVEESMQCPGSDSFVHAGVKVTTTASTTCDLVKTEMTSRINGADGWKDPHNGGIYSILSQNAAELKTQRTTNPAKAVGGKVYVDKQVFSFTDNSDGTCKIEACSESQSTSVKDFSTNYCDIHNLYCNDKVCNPIQSFETSETDVTPRFGSGGKDPSKCVPATASIVV